MKNRAPLLTLASALAFVGLAPGAESASPAITVTVGGQARKPGAVTLTEKRGLMEGIAGAGGFARLADTHKVVVQSKSGETKSYDAVEIISGRTPDLVLRDGDAITISELQLPPDPALSKPLASPIHVTVTGEVGNPHVVTLTTYPSLMAAISEAGSFTRFADKSFIIIKSKTGEEKKCDLSGLTGPTQDAVLHDGDIISVSDRRGSPPEIPSSTAKL